MDEAQDDLSDNWMDEPAGSPHAYGVRDGNSYASEIWDTNEDSTRETIACLVYDPSSKLVIQDIYRRLGLDLNDDYLFGYYFGMRQALDERGASEWLTSLPS